MLGRSVVEVLRHQGVEVYVPSGQTPSWMAMIASGDVVRARKLARQNIRILSEAIRSGYDVVTSEPSAALCLKEEYRGLDHTEDTELIANNTYEINSYLWNMHTKKELKDDFRPVTMSIVYHEPCHARVLDSRMPAYNLMKLIPGLQVTLANDGCSGMAGTYGLQRKNFRTSVRIGRALIATMKDTPGTIRRYRMHCLQAPDGTGNNQAHGPSGSITGLCLWSDATACGMVFSSQREHYRKLIVQLTRSSVPLSKR